MKKDNKKKQNKSISNKIISRILALLIPSLIVLIGIAGAMSGNAIDGLNKRELNAQSMYASKAVDDYFHSKENSIKMFDRNPFYRSYFQAVSKQSDILAYSDIDFIIGELSGTQKNLAKDNVQDIWLADFRSNCFLRSNGEVVPFNPDTETYLSDAQTQKKVVVSEPLKDSSGKLIIKVVTPVFAGLDTEISGFLGYDIGLDSLYTMLQGIEIGKNGYVDLLSKECVYIYSKHDVVGQHVSEINIDKAYEEKVTSKYEGNMEFAYEGKTYDAASKLSDATGWLAVVTIPKTELTQMRNAMLFWLILCSLLVLIVLGAITTVLIRGMMKPLSEIGQSMQELSEGNLNVDLTVDSNDEIGILADDVRVTIAVLKEIIFDISHVLTEIANENLNVAIEGNYIGDFEPIHQGLEKIAISLNDTLTQINHSSELVSSSSEQVSSGSQSLAQGAAEQASSVEELAATINEISTSVQNSAKSAQHASDEAMETSRLMVECNEQMEQMVAAMEHISEASNQIGNIIKTIEDIAFQTNILALNAAVEAARAGEAGKGFAVVADEVRNLASKSAEASKSTVTVIEESLLASENGLKIVREVAESILNAAESAKTVMENVNSISEVSIEQAEAIAQVTQGVDQISSVVQTNSATAEESAAASEELSGQAQIMKNLVDKFQLKQD